MTTHVVLYLLSLWGSLYCLPLEWLAFLKRIQVWLEQRKLAQAQLAADRQLADTMRKMWLSWARKTYTALQQRDTLSYPAIAQALAAGERFLDTTSPTDEPQMYQLTEQICHGLEVKLGQWRRAQKMGPGQFDPAPQA